VTERRPDRHLRRSATLDSNAQQRGALSRALARAPEPQRTAITLEHVLGETATVLGHESPLDPDQTFTDLGLHSLGAVELRIRLAPTCPLKLLPPTATLDFPIPGLLAHHVCQQITRQQSDAHDRRRPTGSDR
jgi:Phosphopantetheine attachment site